MDGLGDSPASSDAPSTVLAATASESPPASAAKKENYLLVLEGAKEKHNHAQSST